MKVVVTGAGALLGQGIIRSLQASSLKAEIVACDPSPLAAGLYWVPHRELIPMASNPAYLDVVSKILDVHRPDALLVGTDAELPIFAANRRELEHAYGTRIIVSSPEVVRIADDKYATVEFLRRNGFAAPATSLLPDVEALIDKVGFPLIVKPRTGGSRSRGVHVVHNGSELVEATRTAQDVVVQESIASDADEYTAGTLSFDGRCRATIVMRRDLRDGNTYRAYVDQFPELRQNIATICDALEPYGPANFQFRLPPSGTPMVFEINGRFSGTTPLRMHAGFNEVEAVLRYAVLGEPVSQPKINKMTILRHWSETVVADGEEVR